jgi:hypothetical protein
MTQEPTLRDASPMPDLIEDAVNVLHHGIRGIALAILEAASGIK